MKKELLEKIHDKNRNIIVVGDISVGKTTNVIAPLVNEYIDSNESMIIVDSKEEYIDRYYDKLNEKDYNIIVLNLRDSDKSEGWNPIEYPYTLYKNGDIDKSLELLEKMAKIIFDEGKVMDPFWSRSASDFFTGSVLGIFEDAKEDEINLNSVSQMFNGVDKKFGTSDYTTMYFKLKDSNSQAYIYSSSTILSPKETRNSILSVARQKLRLYVCRETLNKFLNKTTFNIEDVINKPTAIFIIARDENKMLNSIAALFIEQLFSILVDCKSKNKFNFVLDNFDVIEKIEELENMLSSSLSRNINFIIGTRSIDRLFNVYGSYINKLCDTINVTLDNIEITSLKEQFINMIDMVQYKKCNIEYPKLKNTEIKTFDIEDFVKKVKRNEIEKSFNTSENNLNSFASTAHIDDLIKRIDEKLLELENKE